MSKRRFQRQTFIIQILNNQHASWQGTLTWIDSNETKEFRSALELIRLMDSAVASQNANNKKNISDATEM
ncbi:MAG TPA: hypothetical protein GX701_03810 [Clostridiales bacterium]|jgi:hypothetical protein|nr:hypothetical protein [Clostridiales bacterium]